MAPTALAESVATVCANPCAFEVLVAGLNVTAPAGVAVQATLALADDRSHQSRP